MEAHLRLKHMTVKVEGETQVDLFKELAHASEVFGEEVCGVCGSANIRPAHREVPDGKKVYHYCEWHCQEQKCRARLTMCQNMEGGTLYPSRRLTPDGKPATGKLREQGRYGAHNGWTKYRGETKEE